MIFLGKLFHISHQKNTSIKMRKKNLNGHIFYTFFFDFFSKKKLSFSLFFDGISNETFGG